jgi:hypothetical protein
MARIKACSDGMQLIFRYLLFGYDKIKNDKLNEYDKALFEFITDLENVLILFFTLENALCYSHYYALTTVYRLSCFRNIRDFDYYISQYMALHIQPTFSILLNSISNLV